MEQRQIRLAEELLFSGQKKPSFAKQLYFSIFDSTQVIPFPQLPRNQLDEEAEFLTKVEAFAKEHIDPDVIDRKAEIPQTVIDGLGKLGVLGLTIPKEYGGLGLSQHTYCKVAEILSGRCGSTALFLNAHQSIGLKAILLFGTEEQKKRWLPKLAKGEELAAFALTEPNVGSDASAVETKAEYIPDRKVYRINGRKQWITNGAIAKVLTVMAKTKVKTSAGVEEKITAFLVTPDMPGFTVVEPALEKVGMRGSRTAILDFKDVEVPEENILGPLGGGLKVCLNVLDYGRTTFGATCVGAAKTLLNNAIEHSRTRFQFNRPIGSFGLVKKKISRMAALVYAMDAATYLTAGLVDNHVEDFMLESAMLKVFASDSLWEIVFETMQIFGGRSFFTKDPYERMMRDARLNTIGEGSNEVMRAFIGAVGMRDVGFQLKKMVDALKNPASEYKAIWQYLLVFKSRLYVPAIPIESSQLQEEAALLGKAVRRFGFLIVKLLGKHREGILEEQLELDRIATAAMAIYTITAVLSRTDSTLKTNPSKDSNDLAIAKLYCRSAFESLDYALSKVLQNNDGEVEALSDKITGIQY